MLSFFFFCAHKRKKKQKEKAPAAAPELKNHRIFLNEKNSLRSNSFSFLTENTRFFLTLFHGGRKSMKNMVTKKSDNQINH